MSLSTWTDWFDLLLRTAVSAFVSYYTTKYAVKHSEKRLKHAYRRVVKKR